MTKPVILGMPWLVKENPDIDWTTRRVKTTKGASILHLPLIHRQRGESPFDQVNLCTAKELAQAIKNQEVETLFVVVIRPVDVEESSIV